MRSLDGIRLQHGVDLPIDPIPPEPSKGPSVTAKGTKMPPKPKKGT